MEVPDARFVNDGLAFQRSICTKRFAQLERCAADSLADAILASVSAERGALASLFDSSYASSKIADCELA